MTTSAEQHLTDHLAGSFIRNRPDHPDAELRAIAQGEVNLNDLACHWNT